MTCTVGLGAFRDQITHLSKFDMGFLIGQRSDSTVEVVHFAKCPLPDALQEEGTATAKAELPAKTQTQKNKPHEESSKFADGEWIAHSCEQLVRCLVGGLSVVGLYVAGDKAVLAKQQDSLLKSLRYALGADVEGERVWAVLALVELPSRKVSALCLDVAQKRSTFAHATVAAQAGWAKGWQHLHCDIAIHVPATALPKKFRVHEEPERLEFDTHVFAAIDVVCARVRTAAVVLETSADSATKIVVNGDGDQDALGKGVHKAAAATNGGSMAVYLLQQHDDTVDYATLPEPVLHEGTSARVWCLGSSVCRAVLGYTKISGGLVEATAAIKQDAVRSLRSRARLHCDGLRVLEGDESAGDPEAIHQLPRRVFAAALLDKVAPLPACDYLFEGDTVEDSYDNLRDLFDTTVREGTVEDGLEHIADANAIRLLVGTTADIEDDANVTVSHNAVVGGDRARWSSGTLSLAVATLIVLIAVFVACCINWFGFGK